MLGAPRLEKNLGKEEVLYYGLWQIVFEPDLTTRSRYYKPDSSTSKGEALNRQVVKLEAGTSMKDVKSVLGKPEVLEVFRNAPHKEESLWYGNGHWEINFTNGKLTGKTKF